MNRELIITGILDAVVSANVTVKKENIPLDQGFISSGVLDSFGFVEMIGNIENSFDLEFTDEEINRENFSNVNTIADLITDKIK